MLCSNVLLTVAISVQALLQAPAPETTTVYKIELTGGQTAWSQDKPREAGAALLFHRHPGGLLVSVKKADVKSITASRMTPEAPKAARLGKGLVVLGPTGASAPAEPGTLGAAAGSLLPGERKDGTALMNPDRQFRPEWDTRQVPGLNLGNPNSPNDYKEGRTFAYPPGGATQQAPGDVPKLPAGNGEVPRGPS
jgi:hypothetical protein